MVLLKFVYEFKQALIVLVGFSFDALFDVLAGEFTVSKEFGVLFLGKSIAHLAVQFLLGVV